MARNSIRWRYIRSLRVGSKVSAVIYYFERPRSPLESRGSLFGVCRNPYDTERTTAGSSGGSAAAVAASFGMVALGTDTGDRVASTGLSIIPQGVPPGALQVKGIQT